LSQEGSPHLNVGLADRINPYCSVILAMALLAFILLSPLLLEDDNFLATTVFDDRRHDLGPVK
jgi:hypothetical protein